MIKRVSLIRRKAGMSREEFFAHWTGPHAAIVRQMPGVRGLRFGKVQSWNPEEAAWDGVGEVWFDSMEDAATAEISRAQIWQQLHFEAMLEGGVQVTEELFRRCLAEEMEVVKDEIGPDNYAAGRFPEAIALFDKLSTAPSFEAFLTVPAYGLID